MKKIGHSLYLSGIWLFALTSVYFMLKDYFFQNLNFEDLSGMGSYFFIISISISFSLFISGIIVIKAYERKLENADDWS